MEKTGYIVIFNTNTHISSGTNTTMNTTVPRIRTIMFMFKSSTNTNTNIRTTANTNANTDAHTSNNVSINIPTDIH